MSLELLRSVGFGRQTQVAAPVPVPPWESGLGRGCRPPDPAGRQRAPRVAAVRRAEGAKREGAQARPRRGASLGSRAAPAAAGRGGGRARGPEERERADAEPLPALRVSAAGPGPRGMPPSRGPWPERAQAPPAPSGCGRGASRVRRWGAGGRAPSRCLSQAPGWKPGDACANSCPRLGALRPLGNASLRPARPAYLVAGAEARGAGPRAAPPPRAGRGAPAGVGAGRLLEGPARGTQRCEIPQRPAILIGSRC